MRFSTSPPDGGFALRNGQAAGAQLRPDVLLVWSSWSLAVGRATRAKDLLRGQVTHPVAALE